MDGAKNKISAYFSNPFLVNNQKLEYLPCEYRLPVQLINAINSPIVKNRLTNKYFVQLKHVSFGNLPLHLASLGMILGFAMLAAVPAYADGPAVTVTATPQSLDLCPGDEGKTLVVIQNKGQTPVHDMCLTFFSNGPVTAAFSTLPSGEVNNFASSHESCEGISIPPLPEGGSFSTLVNVQLVKHPVTGASLYFLAKYQFGKPPSSDPATVVGTLDVRGPVMPSTDALKVETKVGFTSLHENEEGRVVLTIANGNNDTLTLSKPQMSKVSHAKVTGSNDSDTVSNASADNGKSILEIPLVISPQSTVAIDFKIKANPTILPGKYIGLIDVDAKTSCGVSLHRVAAYEVTLGVFGQSELLTTIGVPSLLFLPGFLVLSIWLLIWRMGLRVSFLKKEGSSNDFFVAGTDPEFWLLGITFSLLMFISARNLWGLGYQRPYQLSDIATLWGASLGVGLLTYLLIFWVTRWREKYLEGRRVAKLLTSNDSVITALERIIRHGVEIRDCRRVKGNDTANSFCGFRLWSDNKNDMVWVIPPILCRKLNDKPFQLPLPGEKEDTTTIYNFLKKAEDDSLAEISWNSNGSLNKPTEMNITELSEKDESAFYFLVYEEFNKT